jgi:hypothetical protein
MHNLGGIEAIPLVGPKMLFGLKIFPTPLPVALIADFGTSN